jgi:hypothetical protein
MTRIEQISANLFPFGRGWKTPPIGKIIIRADTQYPRHPRSILPTMDGKFMLGQFEGACKSFW